MPLNNMMAGPTPSSVPSPPVPSNPQVQQGPSPPNALAGPQPPAPPTNEALIDAAHKTGYINSMLRELLAKPNISPRDVINGVGHLVSEQIMDVPMAAKYLSDLPAGNDQVRQWLTQHYVTSTSNLRSIAQIIQTRMQATPPPMPNAAPQMPMQQNAPAAPNMMQAPA